MNKMSQSASNQVALIHRVSLVSPVKLSEP